MDKVNGPFPLRRNLERCRGDKISRLEQLDNNRLLRRCFRYEKEDRLRALARLDRLLIENLRALRDAQAKAFIGPVRHTNPNCLAQSLIALLEESDVTDSQRAEG